ncbi:CCA tRNA nucleotidyltransferase [Erythrobacter arachoides]|uniref:CCA tRNA nucleotidyltransferase n=1 Tax=Aurantiacibacter arachoides TaxID=1850444 RepID=A0A845A337_9SPHN|nr:CCA tRNA nucleotidyltransferase [Aurantiacibacter arachoides]MXO93556.1 CCA tRNA nucleotidyltransferase [Aurantiacibacter arachoides]GGD48469.1 poly(A) polymerase [Aurantiacibacter arachoides]
MAEDARSLPPTLPANAWCGRADLLRLVEVLGAENLRWVGGAVRDTLLGSSAHDIDAATTHQPAEVVRRLEAAGIRSVPTGIAHGTITAVLDGGHVEITTLRHDVATDGRHANVAFTDDWREDAARRDFTINALYAHPLTLEIFDWFGGLADLAASRVRFIGDARARIREDHLRILRYYRFQARFGSVLDAEAEAACAELAPMLKGLSRERVGWELQNLLSLADPVETVRRMAGNGVLAVVLPETGEREIDAFAALVKAEADAALPPSSIRRLAALLPADPRVAETVAARLRLSTASRRRLVTAARRDDAPGDARALAFRLGREEAYDRLLLTDSDTAPLNGWDIPQFPLKGGAVVERGVGAGPAVARILNMVQDRWIAEGFPDAERVHAMLEDLLAAERHNPDTVNIST